MDSVVSSAVERLRTDAKQAAYRHNPVAWAKDVLDMHLWSKQCEVAESVRDHKRTVVASAHGTGKVLQYAEPIPVPLSEDPSGWKRAGDLAVGQKVLGSHGLPITITGRTPVQHVPYYRVHFDDGTSIVAGGPHEWHAVDIRHRPRQVADWRGHWDVAVTVTTDEMRENLRCNGQLRWRIPLAQPLMLPEADLPVDPYLLGLWLADGDVNRPCITIGESKLACLNELDESGWNYRCQPVKPGVWRISLAGDGMFVKALRDAGVLGAKYIPAAYLRASIVQRRAVLAGIMDGDGFLTNSGNSCGIDLCHEPLARTFRELVTSLGMKITCREGEAAYTKNGLRHVTGTRYRMAFNPDINPFRARGEAWVPVIGQRSRATQRTVVSIEPEPDAVPGFCIAVDSPDHLYLAGESMVPTHNSCSAGVLACWWVAVHPPGQAIVISTAPTGPQVSAILWEEIRSNHAKAAARGMPLPGYVTMGNEWKLDSGRLVGIGRKPADGDQHAFQGIHRPFVLVLVDEAAGVPEELWTGVEAITTTANSRILAIGNPDDRETVFGEVFCEDRYARMWNRVRIPASTTPNFTGEPVPEPLNDVLVQVSWVQDRLTAWGDEDPRYQSKVEAKFPENGILGLFGPQVLASGFDSEGVPALGPLVLGVDPARYGSDRTAVVARRGRLAWVEESWMGMDTQGSAKRVIAIAERLRARDEDGVPVEDGVEIRVDVIGLGAGVVDRLAEEAAKTEYSWFSVREVNGAAAPPQEQGGSVQSYGNARAYFYDQSKQQMAAGLLKVLPHALLEDELSGVRIRYTSAKMYIESKEEMKKRGAKSPDFADALIYASAPIPDILEVGDVVQTSAEQAASELDALYEQMAEELEMLISPL